MGARGRSDAEVAGDDEFAIAELWAEVRPNQLQLVEELLDATRRAQADHGDVDAWAFVRSAAHRLAGTLGSFGQDVAGEAAVALEEVVSGTDTPDADLAARARALAEAIRAALHHEEPDGAAG
jgi:chemotaxis protein histidine kinase CheA